MTLLQEFIEGLKILAEHYPSANTGADHDKIIIYDDKMQDEDGNPTLSSFTMKRLEDLGLHWDDEEHFWYYFT